MRSDAALDKFGACTAALIGAIAAHLQAKGESSAQITYGSGVTHDGAEVAIRVDVGADGSWVRTVGPIASQRTTRRFDRGAPGDGCSSLLPKPTAAQEFDAQDKVPMAKLLSDAHDNIRFAGNLIVSFVKYCEAHGIDADLLAARGLVLEMQEAIVGDSGLPTGWDVVRRAD